MSIVETIGAGLVVAVLALGMVLGVVFSLRARRQRVNLFDAAPLVAASLGLEVAEPGERLSGARGDSTVQVLWHPANVHSANEATVAWAAIDPPLEIEIVVSTPGRTAGPRQVPMTELGEPPVFLGGRDAGDARRWLGEHREDLRNAAKPVGQSHDVQLEIDRRSVQVRFAALVTEPEILSEALDRAVALAAVVARGL